MNLIEMFHRFVDLPSRFSHMPKQNYWQTVELTKIMFIGIKILVIILGLEGLATRLIGLVIILGVSN